MAGCMKEIAFEYTLSPNYASAPMASLLARASEKTRNGQLQRVLLRDESGRIAGWYLYCVKQDGLAEVLQIAAPAGHSTPIVEHLFSDAWARGATAIAGRLEPHLTAALASRFCLLFRREHVMLVHSRFPDILSAIHSGRAFISRLEGEWYLRFD
jgi:hypothetical protein